MATINVDPCPKCEEPFKGKWLNILHDLACWGFSTAWYNFWYKDAEDGEAE